MQHALFYIFTALHFLIDISRNSNVCCTHDPRGISAQLLKGIKSAKFVKILIFFQKKGRRVPKDCEAMLTRNRKKRLEKEWGRGKKHAFFCVWDFNHKFKLVIWSYGSGFGFNFLDEALFYCPQFEFSFISWIHF